jgi:cobalamin-dependent methionine synthase I
MNRRFSPGYGDLPLNVQAKFLEIMQASKKLGIYLNESDLMIPRKSVTAILGVFENKSL